MTPMAIAYDAYADTEEPFVVSSSKITLIGTGLYILADEGEWIDVLPRSGLAAHYGVTIINSPGLIDPDYTGEIKVILTTHSDRDVVFQPLTRICQIRVMPNPNAEVEFILTQNPEEYVLQNRKKREGLGHTGYF